MSELPLVPGRECGECKVCCSDLAIDTDQIQKTSRLTCKNYKDGCGCQIYETRPNVCRGFYCGWRMLPQLDESWRPNISGVMISFQKNNIPEKYTTRPGFEFVLLDGAAIQRQEVVDVIATCIAAEIPTFLALAGPKGTIFPNTFLNDFTREAIASGDGARIKARLVEACRILAAQPLHPYQFKSTLLPGAERQE